MVAATVNVGRPAPTSSADEPRHWPWQDTHAAAPADVVLTTARDGFAAMGATTYVDCCERELKAPFIAPSAMKGAFTYRDHRWW